MAPPTRPPDIIAFAERSTTINTNTIASLTLSTPSLGTTNLYSDPLGKNKIGTTIRRFVSAQDQLTGEYRVTVQIVHNFHGIGSVALHNHQELSPTLSKQSVSSGIGGGNFAGNNIFVIIAPFTTTLNRVQIWFCPIDFEACAPLN